MIDPLLCSVCLASVDARVIFVAEMKSGESIEGPATNATKIIAWYETIDPVGVKYFVYADTINVLRPVAVWQGTPVCEAHLWSLSSWHWRSK